MSDDPRDDYRRDRVYSAISKLKEAGIVSMLGVDDGVSHLCVPSAGRMLWMMPLRLTGRWLVWGTDDEATVLTVADPVLAVQEAWNLGL
jgi:hypothetical protein